MVLLDIFAITAYLLFTSVANANTQLGVMFWGYLWHLGGGLSLPWLPFVLDPDSMAADEILWCDKGNVLYCIGDVNGISVNLHVMVGITLQHFIQSAPLARVPVMCDFVTAVQMSLIS